MGSSLVDGIHFVGKSSLNVFMFIDSEGDFVNFDLEILNNTFLGLASD